MFAGLAVVCAASLSLVYSHANAVQQTEPTSSSSSAEIVVVPPQSITVPKINSEAETGTGSAFVPSSGATASKPLTVESKPSSKPPKPTPPASSALTNKAKKPTYSSKPKAPARSVSSKPSGGKPGQIYVPGFGWQNPSPKGQMIQDQKTDHDGDINKQIGSMD